MTSRQTRRRDSPAVANLKGISLEADAIQTLVLSVFLSFPSYRLLFVLFVLPRQSRRDLAMYAEDGFTEYYGSACILQRNMWSYSFYWSFYSMKNIIPSLQ